MPREIMPSELSYGTPSLEFVRYRHLNKSQDVEGLDDVQLRDVLVALLQAADAIWDELRAIRNSVESKK